MKTVLVVMLSLVLAACAGTTPRIDPARLSEVQKGKTTVDDVVRQFGKPSVHSRNTDGTQSATYVHGDPRSSESTVVPLIATTPRDSVAFYFDAKGLLTDVKTTQATASDPAAAQAKAATPAAPAGANNPATPATAGNVAPSSTGTTKSGTTAPAPAGTTPPGETRSWSLPGWLPPPTTQNR